METWLDSNDSIFVTVDNCPSELFISDDLSGKTIFTMLCFSRFDRRIKPIGQYKNIRKGHRRIKIIEDLISTFERNEIQVWGRAVINEKTLALQSAENFLLDNKLISRPHNLPERIIFKNIEITYGKLLCLTWYAICLHTNSSFAIKIAEAAKMKQAIAMLDRLPGDNDQRQNNLAIINHIKENSEFKDYEQTFLNTSGVDRFGYGYGKGVNHRAGFDDMKNSHEFCMTDWICHSIYAKFTGTENSEISRLANFLMDKGNLKVSKDFLIVPR